MHAHVYVRMLTIIQLRPVQRTAREQLSYANTARRRTQNITNITTVPATHHMVIANNNNECPITTPTAGYKT